MSIRLSPSQVNLFLNEPSIWVLNKFFGIYGDMGAAAKRGNAVEVGLTGILLQGLSHEQAVETALRIYDEETKDLVDDKKEEERDMLEPMIAQATECFLDMPTPCGTQIRFEEMIFDTPMLGIADFDMGDYLVDLKTTKRCPSCVENISSEHLRQVAYYHHASGKPQKLAYVTPKKYAVYQIKDEQIEKAKKDIFAACKAMWSCYQIEEERGREALTVLYPPRDTASFYWDQKTLSAAQEIWF